MCKPLDKHLTDCVQPQLSIELMARFAFSFMGVSNRFETRVSGGEKGVRNNYEV